MKIRVRNVQGAIIGCGIFQVASMIMLCSRANSELTYRLYPSSRHWRNSTDVRNNITPMSPVDDINISRGNSEITTTNLYFFNSSMTRNQDNQYNIQIEPIYSFEHKKIVLNITWTKPNDTQILFSKIKWSSLNCLQHRVYEAPINRDHNLTNICIPPLMSYQYVEPDCDYNITIRVQSKSSNSHEYINIYYRAPECVGPKCSCKLASPKFESFKVYETQLGLLNTTWKIANNSKPRVTNITNKMFEYRVLNTDQKKTVPFKGIPFVSSNSEDDRNYVLLNVTQFLDHEKLYELRAIFNNSFNCKAYSYANITVTRLKNNIPILQKASQKSSWTVWIISVCFILFVLIAGVYVFNRNRLIIKELIFNPCSINIFRREGRGAMSYQKPYHIIPTKIRKKEAFNEIYETEINWSTADCYEFPREGLSLIKKVGSGAFGEVFSARARNINGQPGFTFVAVKQLKESAPPEEMDDFLSEIDTLKAIGRHPNIVEMLGCCVSNKPYFMIMEYVPCGDLLHYLLDLRETWTKTKRYSSSAFSDISDGSYIMPEAPTCRVNPSDRPSLTETEYTTIGSEGTPSPTQYQSNKIECSLSHTELQQFALQIAKGMEYLEKISITHRDLAARNILINEYKTLKISDFGLSRIGPYVNNRTQKLPLRWLSIEAIKNHFYDSKGDVWSFGIVLWEIGTLGAFPYEGIGNSRVPSHLACGNRLPRPEICTDQLYSLMLRCWANNPQERPSFKELVEILDVKKTRVYVDFGQLNPLYVFPPSSKCANQKCTLTESKSVA